MADKKVDSEQPKDQKKGGKKLLLIILLGVVLLIGGGVAAFLLLHGNANADPAKQAAEKAAKENAVGPMVNIDSFIVNILDKDGTRYLKAALTLELDSEITANEVKERMPQIKDAILLLVSSKTFAELQDLQGKLQLRAELTSRLNDLLKTGKIKQIYFTDFVVQ